MHEHPRFFPLLALCVALGVACSARAPLSVAHSSSGPPNAAGDYAARIDNLAVWRALAATPTRETAAHTEIVKVVIDLEDHERTYFLQTRQWEIHYYFIQRFLGHSGSPIPEANAFWQREYLSQQRRFVQGSIIYFRDQSIWAFELIPQDVLDLPRTIAAFRTVRDHVNIGAELRYHPVPAHHAAAESQLRASIPVVTTDELFANTLFQPLNPGDAYGFLRFFDGPVRASSVRPYDIVVLAEVPLDLPVCAGVITAELQTPLSHIAVLSANRHTPNMALRGATRDPTLRAREGQLVRLHVTPQDYTLTPASQADAERSWAARRPTDDFHPRRSDRDVGLRTLAQLNIDDLEIVGAKAAQLGEVSRIRPPVRVPPAFALPFHAYAEHLRSAGLERELQRLLADPAFRNDASVRESALATFRARVIAAPLATGLAARVRAQITAQFPRSRARFRSSPNAEDLPGFNGAGLYESAIVDADASETTIADAIRRVWASTWSFQGFEERSFYRIVHAEVAMAILVQQSVDDGQAIGVAITGNPFDEGRPGHFINVQVMSGSVTSAANGEMSEQLMFYTYPSTGALERMAASSLTGGRPVLSDAEARILSGVLGQIHDHFYGHTVGQTPNAMDVEFLIAGSDRHVVIVQARPYAMRWDEGRGWARPPG